MDTFFFIGILILIFIGIPIGIGLLLYFVPKRLGFPKTSKYLTISYGILVLTIAFFIIFEDQLFSKNDAKELLIEQGIELSDDFKILHNETVSALADSYHTFTLEISEQDKRHAISEIQNSDNFDQDNRSIIEMVFQRENRYFGSVVKLKYQTENDFIREYFKPSGKEGYAPTFRRISILKFEDIVEYKNLKRYIK